MSEPDTVPMIDPARVYTAREAAILFGVVYEQVRRWTIAPTSGAARSPIRGKLAPCGRRPLRFTGRALLDFSRLRRSLVRRGTGVLVRARSGNAKRLGVATPTVYAVLAGKTWTHVPLE